MKTVLKLFIVLSIALAGFMQSTPAFAAEMYKVKGPGADAFFSSVDESGCVYTDVFVYTRDETFQNPPERKSRQSLAYVSISQYNVCTGESLLYADGFTWIDEGDFQVAKKLGMATLNTTISVYNWANDTWFDVYIDLTWTATGPAVRDSNKYKFNAPGCKYQSQSRGMFRSADVYGTVSDGVTNYTPWTGWGTIFDTRSMEKIVGCF